MKIKLAVARYFTKVDMKVMLLLAIPLILTGMTEASIGFSATFFLAHLGPEYLAAGSLVAWFFATLMIIMWGVIMSVSVLVSHHDGAKNNAAISLVLRDGLWLALILVIPTSILLWNLAPILLWLGQDPATVKLAIPYMHALAWSVFPDFITLCLLQFIIGLGHTRVSLIVTLCWVPISIFFSYVFSFGKFGFPLLGIAGLGWGTTISYWATVVILAAYMPFRRQYRKYFKALLTFSYPKYLWELFRVGLPIGLMWFVEITFFLSLSLIMGHRSLVLIDANQIAMQYVAFFVSIVFSIAQAITVRMGNQLGAKQFISANRAVYSGLLFAVLATLIEVSLYWFAPHRLIALDLKSTNAHNVLVISYVIKFFVVAGCFQLVEAVRISLFGALRALKDTGFTLFTSFLAFWCISIPLGFLFADVFNWGPSGFWWAMTVGALCNVALLIWRYRIKFNEYKKSHTLGL